MCFEVVVRTGLPFRVLERQHRAAKEIEHEPVLVVNGGDAERSHAGRAAIWLRMVLAERHNLCNGMQRVSEHWGRFAITRRVTSVDWPTGGAFGLDDSCWLVPRFQVVGLTVGRPASRDPRGRLTPHAVAGI